MFSRKNGSEVITASAIEITGGVLTTKETTTPTAEDSKGKWYTKSDNKAYVQTGDGTENEIAFV